MHPLTGANAQRILRLWRPHDFQLKIMKKNGCGYKRYAGKISDTRSWSISDEI